MVAAAKADTKIIRLLLKHGADVNAKNMDNHDHTAAWYAVTQNRLDVVRLLIQLGARISSLELLGEAAAAGNNDMVRLLLAHGAKVDIAYDPGSTALMEACEHDHRSTAELLLAHGANINYCSRFGTALTTAAAMGDLPMVRFLVARGADVNVQDAYRTILAAAVEHPDVLSYLLNHGAKVNKPAKWDITPLGRAAFLGATAGIKVLLAHGANINHVDGNGDTPLMSAAGEGHVQAVQALIQGGANVNLRTWHHGAGKKLSALQIAQQAGHAEVVRLLKQAGAKR
jgi:ankyrin repeat protein